MSDERQTEYLCDGIVEDILTALSRFRDLFVIARNSCFTYKGRSVDVKQVGQELGVRYVLEGSIRKAGKSLRITGQLIDAASGEHVWAERYDGSMEEVFALQDRPPLQWSRPCSTRNPDHSRPAPARSGRDLHGTLADEDGPHRTGRGAPGSVSGHPPEPDQNFRF
jgi:hypothetical protein